MRTTTDRGSPAPTPATLAVLAVLLAGGLLVAVVATVGRADPAAEPTIAFVRTAGAACSATPDVSSIVLERSTWLRLRNETGGAVDLVVDGRWVTSAVRDEPVTIMDGVGRSIRLRLGHHTVRLVPRCDAAGPGGVLAVTVVTRRDPPAPTAAATSAPAATASPTPPGAPPDRSPAPSATPTGRGGAPNPGGSASPAVPAVADPAGGSDRGPRVVSAVGPSVGVDEPVDEFLPMAPAGPDRRTGRLLAVVASIGVFGVTSAIIRVMLMQRMTGVVDT